MDGQLLVSVSGIRGVVGSGLDVEVACRFGAALGTHLGGGRVLISRDGRPSGRGLAHAVMAGLIGTGCDVHDVGVAPTPTAGFLVRALGYVGGVQITASHNPAPWNGLKMFGPDGAVLDAAEGQHVADHFHAREFRYAAWDGVGTESTSSHDPGRPHLDAVQPLINVDVIRARRFRVLLDANGGAGGPLGQQLLSEVLGCDVTPIGCDEVGRFDHEPEPIPAHLEAIAPQVVGHDVGFVLDPDADRLALIDETGICLSEELTLALAIRYGLSREPGPIVINMSTSMMAERIADEFGVPCHRSAVGEANVVGEMRRVGACIGGEGNGGVIHPRVGWVRDPFVGMAMILAAMAESGKSLSQLAEDLPHFVMSKTKMAVPREQLAPLFDSLRRHWPDANVNELDGIRLSWEDRWLHVRASNTEPVVRLIAESPDTQTTETLLSDARIALARLA